MSFRNTSTTYGSVAKFFHWLIFILVFFMIILGYFLDDIPKEYKGSVINVHKWIGLTILTLMILRAAWALTNPKPVLPGITAPWEKSVERSVHLLLYLVI